VLLSYYAARANLYALWHHHPEWSHAQLAAALGASKGWVKKWLSRFREEEAQGIPLQHILQGHSRARKQLPDKIHPLMVESILSIRDRPPEGLRRVPGQEAIQYYLKRDPALQLFQLPIPSCKTIYRVLKNADRIASPSHRVPEPVERPAPLTCWQIDFKDVSSVTADPEGKRQHMVETLNIIDMGTSMLLAAHVRSDFTAETALQALSSTIETIGCPQKITLDRDTRWVGSPRGSDFPSALIRFARCLGIQVIVCDPHHPQQNGFVERYNRTYGEEGLAPTRPTTLEQAREVTEAFVHHYNVERPHQRLSCGNRPPATAFPVLPTLPPVPKRIDPDRWLTDLDGMHLERKIDRNGTVSLDLKRYYVSSGLAGQRVSLRLDAPTHRIEVMLEEKAIKSLALRGLVQRSLSFEQFVGHMQHQARAQERLRSLQDRKYRTAKLATP
jgi:transposase InsO family protein